MNRTSHAPSEIEIRALVERQLITHLELPADTRLDPDRAFTDLGLDSTGVHALVGDLEDELGVPVAPETLFDHPTVRDLSAHLRTVLSDQAPPPS